MKNLILGPIDNFFSGHLLKGLSGLVSLMAIILLMLIFYKLILITLRRCTKETSIGGLRLGSGRAVRNLDRKNARKFMEMDCSLDRLQKLHRLSTIELGLQNTEQTNRIKALENMVNLRNKNEMTDMRTHI